MRMNLHHLAIFHAIAETGSMSAAAVKLRISQPALSRELKAFEEREGVRLFERLPRGMRLTEPGHVLHEHACRLFAVADAAQAAMQEFAHARRGQLAIGASNTIGTYVLPQFIAGFRAAYPDIALSIFVGKTEQVARGVADLRFNLGLVEGPLHVEGLYAQQFRTDELIPVVASSHPLATQQKLQQHQLNGLPLLMREPGSGTRELILQLLQQQQIAPGEIIELGNTEAVKQAAIHAAGIAWLPRISVSRELQDGVLHELPLAALHLQRGQR